MVKEGRGREWKERKGSGGEKTAGEGKKKPSLGFKSPLELFQTDTVNFWQQSSWS